MKKIFTPHKLLATSSPSGRLPAQENTGPSATSLTDTRVPPSVTPDLRTTENSACKIFL